MLLVVSHPAVGGGIETLLRLERRFDVRRITRLAEAAQLAKSWPADAALVDAPMLPSEGRVTLGVPALILAGSQGESDAASTVLEDSRGWVAKDASSRDFVAAVERLLTDSNVAVAGTLPLVALGVLVILFLALFSYLVWVAVV